jgi:hypothetical protein
MQENESKPTATKPTKRGKKPSGLGDTIEQITTATGIKAAVDWFSEATGVDCGCDARKEKLNKLFRYRKPECLTKEEYEFIGTMKGRNVVSAAQQTELNKIYNRVFPRQRAANELRILYAGSFRRTYDLIQRLWSVRSADSIPTKLETSRLKGS